MSSAITPKLGWGVVLDGHKFDLEEWAEALKPPHDPHVLNTPRGFVFRCADLDRLASAGDVLNAAQGLLDYLNGTMAALHRAGPVRPTTAVVEFQDDGSMSTTHVAAVIESVMVRSKAAGVSVVVSGNLETTEVQPSNLQEAFHLIQQDGNLADLVTFFSRQKNWVELYKAIESLEILAGGSEYKLKAAHSDLKNEIKRLKRTANLARHAIDRDTKPFRQMDLQEARQLLSELIRRTFRDKGVAGF